MGRAPRHGAIPAKPVTPVRGKKDAPAEYGPELELIKAEIMTQNPGMEIKLAEIIAR